MALSLGLIPSILGTLVADQPITDATPNLVQNVATKLYAVNCDNTGNGVATYLKIYDSDSVTVGDAVPRFIFKVQASSKLNVFWPSPPVLSAACSFAATTTPGTSGTTSPTNNVRTILVVAP
jgi:hypothetical protein